MTCPEDVAVKPPNLTPMYAGDGVYLTCDGFHINIAVNSHHNHVVALEPQVVQMLVNFARRCGVRVE